MNSGTGIIRKWLPGYKRDWCTLYQLSENMSNNCRDSFRCSQSKGKGGSKTGNEWKWSAQRTYHLRPSGNESSNTQVGEDDTSDHETDTTNFDEKIAEYEKELKEYKAKLANERRKAEDWKEKYENERRQVETLVEQCQKERQRAKQLEIKYQIEHHNARKLESMHERERSNAEEWKERYESEHRQVIELREERTKTRFELEEIAEISKPKISFLSSLFDTGLQSVHKALGKLLGELGSQSPTTSSRITTQIEKPVSTGFLAVPKTVVKIPIVISSSHRNALKFVATEFTTELQNAIDNPENIHVDFKVISEAAEDLNQLEGPCSLVLAWSSGRIGWDERKSLFALRQGFGDQRYLVMFRKTDVVVSNDKTRKDQPRDVETKKLPEQITKIVDIYYSRDSKLLRDEQGDLISENLNNLGILAEWISKIVGSDS